MNIHFAIPECRVAHLVERHDDHLVVPVRLDTAGGRCPECGQASRSVHGRYHRHPSDLPLSTSQTKLRIEVRRFYCLNPTCRRRTFAETPTDLLAPHARRTRRLGEAQARVGLACDGAGGARLLAHLYMPASRATVLRLVTRMPMPDTPAPIRVGIDDWAIKKGSRYGTIVVDLDRHRVVDLLPDRTAPTVAGWLERHSGVELVARDRSTEYARGASLGAPQAQQVADRWHLLTNMQQAVERWLQGAHARLRSLPLLPGSTARPARRDRAFARSTTEWKRGHRAGFDGRPSTTRSAAGMPAGSPCSGSSVPWVWRVRRYASMPAPKRSRRGCLTVPGRASLIRTSRTWRGGSTRAARTPSPCGARSGNGATRGRAGKCIASSPSAGRGRSDRAARPAVPRLPLRSRLDRKPVAASTAAGVAARPADLGVG